jgi:hypothetical protein
MEVLRAAAAALETLFHPPDLDYLDELDLDALVKASTLDGTKVRKKFRKRRGSAWYNGEVISVVLAEEPYYYTFHTGETATIAYFVKYEDGDEEHMTQAMVLEHHLAYLEWKGAL